MNDIKGTLLRTSVRLSLQFSFLYALLSAVVFSLAFWFTQFEVKDAAWDQMGGDVETLIKILEIEGPQALLSKIDALAAVNFENTRILQLLDGQGNLLAGNVASHFVADLPDFLDAQDILLPSPLHEEVNGYWMRQDQVGPFTLIQGAGDHILEEILEALGPALVIGYLAVIGLGLLVGVRIGRLTEQRIVGISEILTRAAGGQLDARIPIAAPSGDDLSRVSVEINQMLGQIQRLLESQQQISDDIAHDMRTPLQRLLQRLENLRDADKIMVEDVTACLDQTEEIVATFNALLRIAQIEATTRKERFEAVNLQAIIQDVAETMEPVAEDAGKSLTVEAGDGSSVVQGDRQLLTQMLVNLVDNAIKHSGFGQNIKIALRRHGKQTKLSVSDDGVGIGPNIKEKIFRRFFRAEESRSSPGNGLGLSVVKAISAVHDIRITVEERQPGVSFVLDFSNPRQNPMDDHL